MFSTSVKHDVAFSFAGEDSDYVDDVADLLERQRVKVFYDRTDRVALWGRGLYVHLTQIYQQQAKLTVLCLSAHYASKLWTNPERQLVQARAVQEARGRVLPARFDDTELPGLPAAAGYVGLKDLRPEDFASMIVRKLGHGGIKVPLED